jgi:catechol-2,3-dioxygenase
MQITQIKETCLYITNIESCKEFYHGKLGLPVISIKEGRHIFFRAGSSVLLCFLAEATKNEQHLPPHYAYGKQHIAFEVPVEEYEDWKEKIAKADIAITHCQSWKNELESFYFEDPEGHVLEIVPPGIWE